MIRTHYPCAKIAQVMFENAEKAKDKREKTQTAKVKAKEEADKGLGKISEFICTSTRKKAMDSYLANMIVDCNLPFCFSEHEGFKQYGAAVQAGYVPADRREMRELCENICNKEIAKTKVLFKNRANKW